jgi:DNA end-binding protein Ku
MRPIWSGALSFGLINIPVNLYSATEDHEISFDLLHKKDLSPIRYAKICKGEEKEVPYKDIVKGYKYKEDSYVILTDEDFKKISLQRTKTIEIQFFTDEEEIDSIFYEKPYFLEPSKGASKAYMILREALKKSGKVAVATFILRNREHMAVIKPYEDIIILNQMRYLTEIREVSRLELPAMQKNNVKEVDMAIKLIDQLTHHFNPKKFKDHYVEDLKEMIENKLKGKKLPKKTHEPKITHVEDLMSKLKESLEKTRSHPRAKQAG